MTVAKAHIKLQVWEWIPDNYNSISHVIVYDPATIMPKYVGITSVDGYLEFEVDPGVYVIWVYGHNPMGYRPFLSDTWIPVAILPGETKEVCAALVSLIDIPVLYSQATTGWNLWEPSSFADLLKKQTAEVQKLCTQTAIAQREALTKKFGDLNVGNIKPVEKKIDVKQNLLALRQEWANEVMVEAKKLGPNVERPAKIETDRILTVMRKRMPT